MPSDKQPIYHEKQCKQLCALHALNNLLQQRNAFSKVELDLIAENLSPNNRLLNPHKSVLGIGNYDVNVVMAALQTKDYEALWFDKRRDPQCLQFDQILGFILNIPNPSFNRWSISSLLSMPANFVASRKHWIAIRHIDHDQYFYNLDSKLDSPELIGKEKDMIEYLRQKVISPDVEIFIVVRKEVAENQSWLSSSHVDKRMSTNTDDFNDVTARPAENGTTHIKDENSQENDHPIPQSQDNHYHGTQEILNYGNDSESTGNETVKYQNNGIDSELS